MPQITSADGTKIAYEKDGSGPPLVVLHGGGGSRNAFDTIRPHLTSDFTVVVPDRRGRGASGDADQYTLDREVADLHALVDAVDGEPAVFGHSFGGLVTLAAAESLAASEILLYEPAILVGEHRNDDLAARMETRLDGGDRKGAMALFVQEAGTVEDVDSLPWWPEEANLHLTETVIRENYEVEAYQVPDSLDIDPPTLLITGEEGPEHLRDGVFELADRIPDSQLVELAGVGHVGIESAPERLAAVLRSFV